MPHEQDDLLFRWFAGLLDYPTSETTREAAHCLEQLKPMYPEAAMSLATFAGALQQRTLENIQELYTTTFDMQPVCYPYVGYQLFGESYKRGAFMAQLNDAYRDFGYSAGQELPDHLPVIVRFLGISSAHRAGTFCQPLLLEGVIPALEKMLKMAGEGSENPYVGLLAALHLFLVRASEKELAHA